MASKKKNKHKVFNLFYHGSKEYDRQLSYEGGLNDPYPNSSGSKALEEMFTALFAGEPNPYPLRIPTYNGRSRKREEAEYPIVNHIYLGMCELFEEGE